MRGAAGQPLGDWTRARMYLVSRWKIVQYLPFIADRYMVLNFRL